MMEDIGWMMFGVWGLRSEVGFGKKLDILFL
jgi:hypothetical protein